MMFNKFYRDAEVYWAKVPATIDGVLCGFGNISETDINGSKTFLQRIFNLECPPDNNLALDCGAGIGRVTINLLIPNFKKVDLVEQDGKFVKAAKELIGENNSKLGDIYKIGLQHFNPNKLYDVIWCQWVLGHLIDNDLIAFLKRCASVLNKNGVIVIKENFAITNEVEYDEEDSSVTRSHELLMHIFDRAKLKLIFSQIQEGFPEDVYPVQAFALRPVS